LKKIFKLLVSEHLINEFEDRLLVILVKLLDKAHLLEAVFKPRRTMLLLLMFTETIT
jgi:hypothetical protein